MKMERIDPGADRVSAVPVHDACKLFPNSLLITLNVTEEEAFYREDLDCEVREIRVQTGSIGVDAFKGEGPDFDAAYEAGYDAVMRAFDRGLL
jgi:NTE family protein